MLLPVNPVFAETILPISVSNYMDDIIFDGKWSFFEEWKHSSYEEIKAGNHIVEFRISHQDEFIYAFVDNINDHSFDRGSDYAMLCFDTKTDKSLIADINDYCFKSVLGRHNPITLQGGSPFGFQNNFKKIQNNDHLIAIAGISDQNDRYSKQPHVSYEFKIPLELLGRSNHYGFFISVFDGKTNSQIIWPENKIESNSISISSPSLWGDLVSPDKSLPEFSSMSLFFVLLIIMPIFFLRFKKNTSYSLFH